MSCQIQPIANISDIDAIRRFFFPTSDDRGSDSWLLQCGISISPVGDLIALVREKRLVVLTSKWNSASGSSQYQTSFSGMVDEADDIKAVLCLPIVGQSKSSHVSPDWTCILLGFESGYVRAYIETGELLYEEQFHNEPITNIKCQSQHNPRADIATDLHSEEVYIHYSSNVCIIPGNQLFSILRSYRAQYARVQANSDLLEIAQPKINVKKWGFQDQSVINDIAIVGQSISNSFDHLLVASTCGGFESKVRSTPPYQTLVLAAGSKPFLGFHYATIGINQPVLSDVAKAVAYKLKSALPSWLTGTPQVEKRPSITLQPVDNMGCRFGLCDLHRVANTIILSPDHKLAAVSDNLGRVILIDTDKGVALKILKGYRDAQCSFIQVPDERRSKQRIGNKVALFLVIYSGKKGTLEIFTTQKCTKITTFSASKYSRLIYCNYSLMGFSQPKKSKYICQFTTVFLDNDGQMKEILIPFHFSLSEKNNKRARDIHLYKKFKHLLVCENSDDTLLTEALNTIQELKTTELKSQFIELLSTSKNLPVEILLKCAQYFVENSMEETEDEGICQLKIKTSNIVSLLNFYLFIMNAKENSECTFQNDTLKGSTSSILKLDEKEVRNLQKLLDLNTINDNKKPNELKVTFAVEEAISISDLLAVFNLLEKSYITLLPNQDEAKIYNVSKALFHNYIGKDCSCKYFSEEVLKSKLNIKDLCFLVIIFWVNRPLSIDLNLENEMNHLTSVLYILVKMSKDILDEDEMPNFWCEIRQILSNSNRPFPSLTAAIICKYVAFKIEREKDMADSSIVLDDDDIEIWSEENVEWTLLIGKLEDVSLLNILITNKPIISKNCSLPKLYHEKLDVSLKSVLQKKGSVSELVARWLTMSGIDPLYLVINDKINRLDNEGNFSKTTQEKDENEPDIFPEEQINFVQSENIFEHFNMMRKQWPYSLEAGMVLANMSWEYAFDWKKNIQNLKSLEACISCLRNIPNYFLKLGLFNLVWKTHLNILFESTTKLLNKVGKVPKERLCIQDTGLSHLQIPVFINICTEFLDVFSDEVKEMYNVPKEPLNFESVWENGGQPLAELAIQQTNINFDLLLVHYELSLVFQMLCTFSISAVKPISALFDCEVISVLYHDFLEKPEIDYSRTDSKLTAGRIQFLTKVISSSIEAITVKDGKVYSSDHVRWMSKCSLLGLIWNLDMDVIRMHQVVQLFTHGYNIIGQELSNTVSNRNKLGKELLAIAGKRMSKRLATCTNLGTQLSVLTPTVTRYMDRLNKDWCAESTLKDIIDLTTLSVNCMDSNLYEYKIGMLLYDACIYLRDTGN